MPPTTLSPGQQWALKQCVFEEVLKNLEGDFSSLSVRFMPIKGAYLIASGLASKMAYRRMDDIDLLVLPDDFSKVSDHFAHNPKARIKENYWPFETSFYYDTGKATVFVEIHHQLNYPERFVLPAQDLFSHAMPANGAMVLPCQEDALLILLCHVLVHIAYEFRETVFEEISLITGMEGFSWDRFWERAGSTGIIKFIVLLVTRYNEKTGGKIPVPALSPYSRLIKALMDGGAYGLAPAFVRKGFIELPFSARPARLLWNRLRRQMGRPDCGAPAPRGRIGSG